MAEKKKLAARFAELKKKVGGNREKSGFEMTFGTPKMELDHITPPNKWIRRILSETEFALQLSKENGGIYDADIDEAMTVLENGMEEDGVLTKHVAAAAEEKLMPLSPAAKEYGLILAGHAHIDMNWMWGWQETVAIALSTFRTMLHIMDEYPEFCFSQSQASVYQIVETYDPDLMEEIKKRIREGRWEITASAWVETDKNMPTTASLLNHIKYTKKYLQEHWDVDPASLEIDFSPDTFGHSANLPELDAHGGVKYYYHCRGLNTNNTAYRWRAPSGREMICYKEPYWYNSGITPDAGIGAIENAHRTGGLKTGLIVYGVGDHGGGPTRRDVERAIEMMSWPVFPNFKFGTVREYFKKLETVRENLPVVDHELNFMLTGCYTTQSRLKLGNRHAEAALSSAQTFSALASRVLGQSYAHAGFEKAWQDVLFTHFHDILTGSCVQESREHAMGLIADAMAIAHTRHSNATRTFSEAVDTSFVVTDEDIESSQSEGAGAGYGIGNYSGVPNPERGAGKTRIFTIFNPAGHRRTDCVEITVWDYVGDLRYISLKDAKGQDVPFQLLDTKLENYWDHKYFRILAEVTVPAMGYTTVVLREEERDEYAFYSYADSEDRTEKPTPNYVLENDHVRAEFHYMDGSLISFIDKETGEERIGAEHGSIVLLNTEDDSSSAWRIGHYLNRIPVSKTLKIHAIPGGNLRNGFEMEQQILNSFIKTVVTLDRDAKMITYKFTVDWNEKGVHGANIPVLAYYLPLRDQVSEYIYDVPAGAVTRGDYRGEVPGLQYGAAKMADGRAVAIITDCKYGYRGADSSLTSTLINSATNPDPDPERGMHQITLSVAAAKACPKALEDMAEDKNHAMNYEATGAHKGTLPAEASLMQVEPGTAVLAQTAQDADGMLVMNFFETCGLDTEVKITLPGVKKAEVTDLFGEVTGSASVEGDTVTFPVKAHCVATVKLGKALSSPEGTQNRGVAARFALTQRKMMVKLVKGTKDRLVLCMTMCHAGDFSYSGRTRDEWHVKRR